MDIVQGTVRYDVRGKWVTVDPHDRTYSIAVMLAQEVFVKGKWRLIEKRTVERENKKIKIEVIKEIM